MGSSHASAGDEEAASLAITLAWWGVVAGLLPRLGSSASGPLPFAFPQRETRQREWGKERSEPQVLT